MKNWHSGEGCIGPDDRGVIRRGIVIMRRCDDLTVEWNNGTISEFIGQDVEKLAKRDAPSDELLDVMRMDDESCAINGRE